jgi:Putative esterase
MNSPKLLKVVCVLAAVPILGAAQTRESKAASAPTSGGLRFEVSIADSVQQGQPLTGHLILCVTRPDTKPQQRGNENPEPRFEIDESYHTQQAFGVDVSALAPGGKIIVDAESFGYPLRNLQELPPGEYVVQAVLNKYEEFHPNGGKPVWLPPDHGEGQHWNRKPGNPMSAPLQVHLDGKSGGLVKLMMDRVVGPLTEPEPEPDTQQLKHIKIKSEMLSKFWGRDTYIGAMVLLPAGWDEHQDAHYPVVVWQDHFQSRFRAPAPWREVPPDSKATGFDKLIQVWSYRFYQDWMNGVLPHVILVVLNHANPYYDDSYAVNSANIGPYGDAITQEVIPEIEKRYHGIGQGWARGTVGGSTGGWEALAQQIFYPDFYNGAWGLCPDPVDFHAYQVTNLYDDKNAYERSGPFASVQLPSDRSGDGDVTAEMAQVNHYEYVLGTKGRSGEQYDIWQAVFSPVGSDGYPRPIYDKVTGVVDKETLKYWHDHYDLDAVVMRDWATLGPKLEGKLHFAVGLSDTFYLNNAVHLMQQSLESTQRPHSDATFDYGPWAPHCFTGSLPDWDESKGLDLEQRVLPLMVKHMVATAPKNADVTSWRY